MPSYMDTTHGYVQWQSARRRAKQMAQDAAIDIIEHYNRALSKDGPDELASASLMKNSNKLLKGQEESPRALHKLTPRTVSKKRLDLERHGGVFTEGISSLSRRSQFSLSLKRSDIVSENLPDNVKVAREKSRIYLALSQPGANNNNKGDISAKSGRSLPPPTAASFPPGDMLVVPEVARAKTFTLDERANLSTRSTLDSRQTVSDSGQGSDPRRPYRQPASHLLLHYPAVTGAPPNTPLNMPAYFRPKPPSVNIVSLGGESVESTMARHPRPPRLAVPYKALVTQDQATPRGKGTASTMTGSLPKATPSISKPGIDLPHLPLRYSEAKDATFQFTPRERPGRMNYNRGRRHVGLGHLRQSINARPAPTYLLADYDAEVDTKSSTNDPYADRFRHESSVMSLGEVFVPYAPPTSAGSVDNLHSGDLNDPGPEPTVMLTVHEEDGENAGEQVDSRKPSVSLHIPTEPAANTGSSEEKPATGAEESPQVPLSERLRHRSQSNVSNASLLSVPLVVKDFIESRPPVAEQDGDEDGEGVVLHVPAPPPATEEDQPPDPATLHLPLDQVAGNGQASELSPDTPPVTNTARTVATQTSLPYDPPEQDLSRRPTMVKIKTLSMFPDINGAGTEGEQGLRSAGQDPLLRASHADPLLDAGTSLTLPQLHRSATGRRESEDDEDVFRSKSNGVQNITFISPLNVQQNAKRF